jgi:hypothetical protein
LGLFGGSRLQSGHGAEAVKYRTAIPLPILLGIVGAVVGAIVFKDGSFSMASPAPFFIGMVAGFLFGIAIDWRIRAT